MLQGSVLKRNSELNVSFYHLLQITYQVFAFLKNIYQKKARTCRIVFASDSLYLFAS